MKTPEEMAYEYGEKFDGVEISKNDINIAWYTGYKAAQDEDSCEHILDMSKMVDVNGWISVHDRLPDEEIDVLVCCEIRINGNLIKRQQVVRFIGEDWDTSLPGSITYWQVLPKLPGE